MKFNQYFAIVCVSAVLVSSVDAVIGPAAALVPAIQASAAVPIIGAKKALLLAPLALPVAAGKLAIGAVGVAVPAGIGAVVGAPLGAIVGAKAGAVTGAAMGKALLVKKAALATNAVAAGAALAAKPVVLVLGAKAKAASVGVAFLGKIKAAAGNGIALVGQKLNEASEKVQTVGANLVSQVGTTLQSVPKVQVPSLTENINVPTIPLETLLTLAKGPHTLESSVRLNTPFTGERYKKASVTVNRRRREADPQFLRQGRRQQVVPGASLGSGQGGSQVQQLINFVRTNQLQGCLARIVCELSANPSLYGPEGVRFGSQLLTLGRVQHPETAQYRSASNVGTQLRQPEECVRRFPQCTMPSPEIIRMGNSMLARN